MKSGIAKSKYVLCIFLIYIPLKRMLLSTLTNNVQNHEHNGNIFFFVILPKYCFNLPLILRLNFGHLKLFFYFISCLFISFAHFSNGLVSFFIDL